MVDVKIGTSTVSGISDIEIDAGAKALRERMQAGKNLNAWETLPNSVKKKWRGHSACVLAAAIVATT